MHEWTVINGELVDKINDLKNENINSTNLLQIQIDKNKVTPEDSSILINEGNVDENNNVIPTTIKVKIDANCEHIKLSDNGIYFDGYFGTF